MKGVSLESYTKPFTFMKGLTEFPLVLERGCGLDVHQKTVVATVQGTDIEVETRTFGTFTSELKELGLWLNSLGVTHIAMESTGIYWKPVFNILEEDFEILLVNARHIKNVPGRKTDKKDSAWITKLLLSGLLKGSFVPSAQYRELRDLYRYKRKLIGMKVSERNRLHKQLEDANIKIASVLSDVFGVSGSLILEQLIQGEEDPLLLANLAKGQLRKKIPALQLALEGHLRDHHRFMLKTLCQSIKSIENTIREVETRIEHYLQSLSEEMALLETIPGVGRQTAGQILAEITPDMSAFPDHKHLASWAGIAPGSNESAGKKKSTKITHGNKHLKTALVEAAWAASHTKDTYLNRKFVSLVSRRGPKKALVAVGHKILIASYHILKTRQPYQEPDDTTFREKRKQAFIKKSLERLRELGVEIRLN